jgi:hypothetical protein
MKILFFLNKCSKTGDEFLKKSLKKQESHIFQLYAAINWKLAFFHYLFFLHQMSQLKIEKAKIRYKRKYVDFNGIFSATGAVDEASFYIF